MRIVAIDPLCVVNAEITGINRHSLRCFASSGCGIPRNVARAGPWNPPISRGIATAFSQSLHFLGNLQGGWNPRTRNYQYSPGLVAGFVDARQPVKASVGEMGICAPESSVFPGRYWWIYGNLAFPNDSVRFQENVTLRIINNPRGMLTASEARASE